MSHTLARIIHGGVELCLLKIIQEMLTDRKDAVLNRLSLLTEESVLPFFSIHIYILRRSVEGWERWQILLEGAVSLNPGGLLPSVVYFA